MSTGLAVFDTTVRESNSWLAAIQERLRPCTRQQAYAALRAALHVLRDRLPPEGALALSAQLPMLLRGLFLEGWEAGPAGGVRDPDAFCAEIEDRLPPAFPRDPRSVAEAVFAVLAAKVDPGQARKLLALLPPPLRTLWPKMLWAV